MTIKIKKLLLTNSIISFIIGAFWGIVGLFITFDIAEIQSALFEIFDYAELIVDKSYFLYMSIFECFILCIVTTILGFYFIKLKKSTREITQSFYTSIIFISILEFLCFNIINMILLLIIIFDIRKSNYFKIITAKENVINSKDTVVEINNNIETSDLSDDKLNNMSKNIQKLKEMKEQGLISDSEYLIALNKILEENA